MSSKDARCLTDKTVGNTAVGVLANTVHYHMPYRRFVATQLDIDGPRTASSSTLSATGGKVRFSGLEILLHTFLASDRINGDGDDISA